MTDAEIMKGLAEAIDEEHLARLEALAKTPEEKSQVELLRRRLAELRPKLPH